MPKQYGFTLLEIMVALFMVAVVMLSVVQASSQYTRTAVALEQRLMANWVASDHLSELRLRARTERVRTGSNSDDREVSGRSWQIRTEIEETEVEQVYLVTVIVREDNEANEEMARLVSAIGNSL